MFPPELVELIIQHGWFTLCTSSHRHAYSMTCWMLVSREWLSIAVPIFLRDVWATCGSIRFHLFTKWRSDHLVYRLAGITDLRTYLAQNCRSLTVSVFQKFAGDYECQCNDMADYVANKSDTLRPRIDGLPHFGIPLKELVTVIRDFVPNITSLHFVLVDYLPTFWYWDRPDKLWPNDKYPDTLTDLHITFAYNSPPPSLLTEAARGTFFPPRQFSDLSHGSGFDSIKKLVVREANTDFVAFFTRLCPRLECIESTAPFGVEDLPLGVINDSLVFRRLAPTTDWGITGSDVFVGPLPLVPTQDTPPMPEETMKSLQTNIAMHINLADERANSILDSPHRHPAGRHVCDQSILLEDALKKLQAALSYPKLADQVLEYSHLVHEY
ncbi:hypothetical protein FB45DRAFT_1067516, partial [Roridomyces roridus]